MRVCSTHAPTNFPIRLVWRGGRRTHGYNTISTTPRTSSWSRSCCGQARFRSPLRLLLHSQHPLHVPPHCHPNHHPRQARHLRQILLHRLPSRHRPARRARSTIVSSIMSIMPRMACATMEVSWQTTEEPQTARLHYAQSDPTRLIAARDASRPTPAGDCRRRRACHASARTRASSPTTASATTLEPGASRSCVRTARTAPTAGPTPTAARTAVLLRHHHFFRLRHRRRARRRATWAC